MKQFSLLIFAFLFAFPLSSNATVLKKSDIPTVISEKQDQTWLEKKISNWLTKKRVKTEDPCDVIYLQDGNEISAKVSEITDTEVKYKKCNNLSGPNITVSKSKIWKIKYANGEIDVLNKLGTTGDDKPGGNSSGSEQKTEPLAIAGMVTGVASLILSFGIIGLACGVVGVVLSVMGLNKIKKDPKHLKGKGLAKAGMICGIIGCALYLLILAAAAA